MRLRKPQPQAKHQRLVGPATDLGCLDKITSVTGKDQDLKVGRQLDIPVPPIGQPGKYTFEIAAQRRADLFTGRRTTQFEQGTGRPPVINLPANLHCSALILSNLLIQRLFFCLLPLCLSQFIADPVP